MGEKSKKGRTFEFGGKEIFIELNEGYDRNYAKYDIHIQSESIQYCLTDREYIKFASAMATARRNLEKLKGGEV